MSEVTIDAGIVTDAYEKRDPAALKTYRCEICGEPYYSDEVKTKIEVRVDEGDHGEVYGHICSTCAATLQNVLKNPGVIDDAVIRVDAMTDIVSKMKDYIDELHGKLFPYSYRATLLRSGSNFADCSLRIFEDRYVDIDVEYSKMKDRLKELDEENEKVKKSRIFWLYSFWTLVGGIIGSLIIRALV